ncbi:hypothetical protein ACSLBF_02390 [Pseudoalteromonas sp. T1lg65]|uniref:hypothetical protein n=1 Tax=Pseudoalteromonas sp. T1lg65 TaxID=2077101 RepID=UPI003F7A1D87
MLSLSILLVVLNLLIAYQCYRYANLKGYPLKLFTVLGLIPYFNLVVWVYLLFLPNLVASKNMEQY